MDLKVLNRTIDFIKSITNNLMFLENAEIIKDSKLKDELKWTATLTPQQIRIQGSNEETLARLQAIDIQLKKLIKNSGPVLH